MMASVIETTNLKSGGHKTVKKGMESTVIGRTTVVEAERPIL